MYGINKEHLMTYTKMPESYKHCRNKYKELKKTKQHYLGVVPVENADELLEGVMKERKMKSVYLLCQTNTRRNTTSLENKLRKTSTQKCLNKDEETDLTSDSNYIYLLMR